MLFDTLDTVVRLMRKASTTTGLQTTVNVIHRIYETGRKVADSFKAAMTILFDDLLPKWGLRQNLWVKNGPTGDSSWQGGFSEGWQGK